MSDYFTKVLEDDLKTATKPQYVDQVPKAIKSAEKRVGKLMEKLSNMDNLEKILDVLGRRKSPIELRPEADRFTELRHVLDRDVGLLSGGELQRFAIGSVCVTRADV